MASHVDHTEHDVDVVVTEQGLADLRGLAPRDAGATDHSALRAPVVPPDRCAITSTVPSRLGRTRSHTPHLLDEALSWHQRYLDSGSMLPALQDGAPSVRATL